MPGSCAFSSTTSLTRSKALSRSDLPSGGSVPSLQYLATVCLSMPCLLAMSLKLGFVPHLRYMLSSPITFLSMPAPSVGFAHGRSEFAHACLVRVRLRKRPRSVCASGRMHLLNWCFSH